MSKPNPSTKKAKKLTPQQRVLKKYPRAGVELSAMHGFRIMDYANPEDRCPPILSAGCKDEAGAWRSADRRVNGIR